TWLAKQNQQWSTFTRYASAPDPEAWRSDKPHERIGYLTWFRGKDPASARELVCQAWTQPGHAAEVRAAYVEALAVGLSSEDERRLAKMQPSYWLEDLIASTPLPAWEHFGLSPARLLRATAANRWEAASCHRGWRSATLRQRDAAWAEAFCAVNAATDMLE